MFLDNADKEFCMHHKEKDDVSLATHGYWKPKLSNKHYHLPVECILGQNPSFKPRDIAVTKNPSPELVKTIKNDLIRRV